MRTCVFSGPTISADEGRQILEATYFPPVAQGDVYDAARSGMQVVAIVDGYFERVPAVWHREILWAMSKGVHVFGSASMGALRAAELHAFGMVGIGEIFEAFLRGDLEDDDEVAVSHGDGESNYRPSSEAMVNVRATIAVAVRASIVSAGTAAGIIDCAKSLFYPNRNYPEILRLAISSGLPPEEISRLSKWLPPNIVNQKHADAVAMLKQIAEFRTSAPGAKAVRYHFQHTDAWEQVQRQIERRPLDVVPSVSAVQSDAVLDELRIRAGVYRDVWRSVLVCRLALRLARSAGERVAAPLLLQAVEAFRRERRLATESEIDRWIDSQGWTREDLLRAIEEDALAGRVIQIQEADLERHLADALRLRGLYGELAERARAKHEALTARGLTNPSGAQLNVRDDELFRWFFAVLDVPITTQPEVVASNLGLTSLEALRRLALRELAFDRTRRET